MSNLLCRSFWIPRRERLSPTSTLTPPYPGAPLTVPHLTGLLSVTSMTRTMMMTMMMIQTALFLVSRYRPWCLPLAKPRPPPLEVWSVPPPLLPSCSTGPLTPICPILRTTSTGTQRIPPPLPPLTKSSDATSRKDTALPPRPCPQWMPSENCRARKLVSLGMASLQNPWMCEVLCRIPACIYSAQCNEKQNFCNTG